MTFHFELAHHPNKSGEYNTFLLVFHKGERKRLKTTVTIQSKYWDYEKERVKKTCPTARKDNEELQRLLDKARTAERELASQDRLTLLKFIDKFQGKEQSYMLLSYAEHSKDILEQGKQWGTYKKYGDTVNKLTDYVHSSLGVRDLDFRDVTPAFISGFVSYLQSLPNRRNPESTLSPNSIAKHLKVLRAILNKAVDDGIISQDDLPRKITTVKEVEPAITGLSESQLNKLISLPMKEHSDRWDARNAWLFAMYEGGIRIGDLIQLRWRNIVGDRLVYTMTKNGKPVNVILVQEAIKILKLYKKPGQLPRHYIFPYLDNNAEYAKYLDDDRKTMPSDISKKYFEAINSKEARIGRMLREIRCIAGIPHMTFHSARHTFALRAKEANVDNTTLKNILQHSSLNTTEVYVKKLDCSREDAAMKVMYLDQTHHNKEKKRIIKQIKKLGFSPEELIELLSGE